MVIALERSANLKVYLQTSRAFPEKRVAWIVHHHHDERRLPYLIKVSVPRVSEKKLTRLNRADKNLSRFMKQPKHDLFLIVSYVYVWFFCGCFFEETEKKNEEFKFIAHSWLWELWVVYGSQEHSNFRDFSFAFGSFLFAKRTIFDCMLLRIIKIKTSIHMRITSWELQPLSLLELTSFT